MKPDQAIDAINEAFRAAKVIDAANDPAAESVTVEIDGQLYGYTFQSGANRHGLNDGPDGSNVHARRDELAVWLLKLIDALCGSAPTLEDLLAGKA